MMIERYPILSGIVIAGLILAIIPLSKSEVTQPADLYMKVGPTHGSAVHLGDGIVLTAAHNLAILGVPTMIRDQSGKLQPAETLWASTPYDVALLKIEDHKHIAAATLDCNGPKEGSEIRGVGNPLEAEFNTSWGHVAGKPRDIKNMWKSAVPMDMSVIQGMSGGAVYDTHDDVVGIMVGYAVSTENGWSGFGHMVPSNTLCNLMGKQ